MNVVELLAIVRKCFEDQNPKVLIPKKFSSEKMGELKRATDEVKLNISGASLINLVKVWVKMLANDDMKAYDKCMKALKSLTSLPPVLVRRLQKLQGEGQLRFATESPAGPSRLCRVPFYPIRSENAWSTRYLNIDTTTPSRQAFGIETLGDDPILSIGPWFGSNGVTTNQNSNKISSIQLSTQKVEFGAYRLIGMEVNAYFGSRYIGALTTGPQQATGTITNQNIAAVAADAVFSAGGASVQVGLDINVRNSAGLNITVTSANPAINPNEFSIGVNSTEAMASLAVVLDAVGGISAVAVGLDVTVTQDQIGTVENGQLATSSATGVRGISNPGTFTGGIDNITDGLLIVLEDVGGLTETFEFDFAGGGVAPGNIGVTIDNVTPAQSMRNLNDAINASALDMIAAHTDGTLVVNVTQDDSGAAGNIPITSSIGAQIAVVGFAGGAAVGGAISLNLTNNLSPIAISVKDLTVYNGNNILIVEDGESVSASEFNIIEQSEQLQFSYTWNGNLFTPEGQTAQPLTESHHEDGYKFIGFRDQPIVDPNSQVFVKVDAFISNLPVWATADPGYPADTPLPKIPPVSFSINLVVDLLEDKVFGDVFAPSPASRAAANVKLSARDIGDNRIVLENSVSKKPEI
jgi:hypothetical protein